MIFLDFIFEDRDITWLSLAGAAAGQARQAGHALGGVALVALVIAGTTVATAVPLHGGHGTVDKAATVLLAGVARPDHLPRGRRLSGYFEEQLEEEEERRGRDGAGRRGARAGRPVPGGSGSSVAVVGLAGKAAFFMFLYLEVLDASFSFDGVIGAFAITNDIIDRPRPRHRRACTSGR